MKYQKQLDSLAQYFRSLNLTLEAEQILKIKYAQQYTLTDWEEVLAEVQTPLPKDIEEKVFGFIFQNIAEFIQVIKQVENTDPDDLQHLTQILEAVPPKTALSQESQILKMAQEVEAAGKSLGLKSRLVPVIGPLFSGAFFLKNIWVGIQYYRSLIKESDLIGLSWTDTLYPLKLKAKIEQYQNDPHKLKIVAKTTKFARKFADEAISGAANALDFLKDVFFALVDIFSLVSGWLAFGAFSADIALSAVLIFLEWTAESYTFEDFDTLLTQISEIAEDQIQKITPQADEQIDYSNMELDELLQTIQELFTSPEQNSF